MAKGKSKKLWVEPLALGLGLMDLTRDKLKKLVKDVQKDITEKDKKKAVDRMVKLARQTKTDAEKMIRGQIKRVIDELGLATKDDIKKLKRK